MSAHHKHVDAADVTIPDGHFLKKTLPVALIVTGLVGIGVAFALRGGDRAQFGFSYLTAFMFFLSMGLGGLFFVLIHHATRSSWSTTLRRLAESFMMGLPAMVVLFVPILLGIHDIYEWSHPEVVARDAIIEGKSAYLNEGFFLIRYGVLAALWCLLAFGFYKLSTGQDEAGNAAKANRARWWAPVGIIVFALTTSVAAVDWMMSIDPHWFSTIFGVYYFAGSACTIFAMLIVASYFLQSRGFLKKSVTVEHYHDLGKFLFGFSVFWTYIAFSQYFLIWYANVPEETYWFAYRWVGSWQAVSVLLGVGHFLVPFFFLMSRHIKRRKKLLLIGAVWLLLMHLVDMYWLIQPAFDHHFAHTHGATFHVMDILCLVGVGGVFLGVVAFVATRRPLIPVKDPRIEEGLNHESYPSDVNYEGFEHV